MSESGQNQLPLGTSTQARSNNAESQYQMIMGDNQQHDPNLSQSQHFSQSVTSFAHKCHLSHSSSSSSIWSHHSSKPYQNYTSHINVLILILFVIVYILLVTFGAAVFSVTEQKAEFELRDHILDVQHEFLATHPSLDAESLDAFLDEVFKAYDNGVNLHFLNKIIKMKTSLANQVSADATSSITYTDTPIPSPPQPTTQKALLKEKGRKIVESLTTKPVERVAEMIKAKVNPPTLNEEAIKEFSNWEYTSSLVFVASVVTTIGYGHVTPITDSGKIFNLVFSCVAIPFTMVILSTFVVLLKNGPVKRFEKMLFKKMKKRGNIPEFFIRILHVFIVTVILLILILILPAVTFCYIEDWSFFDSLYYCYISLTTVGLGDFVAATNHLMYSSYLHYYRLYIVFYLYTGLGLILLWMAVILRIPLFNWRPFILTEFEDDDDDYDEGTPIIDREAQYNYGTQFYPQK